MQEAQKKIEEKTGTVEDELFPQLSAKEIAEDAYLIAEYTKILVEFMMEG